MQETAWLYGGSDVLFPASPAPIAPTWPAAKHPKICSARTSWASLWSLAPAMRRSCSNGQERGRDALAPGKMGQVDRCQRGGYVSPLQDIHGWLETRTHVIDFTTGDTMGESGDLWPPLIHWPKWRFPKHPREARAPGSILLWRNAKAWTLSPRLPLLTRAFEIYGVWGRTREL